MAPTKTLILVAIKGTNTKIVFGPADAKLCAWKKKELIASGNWRGYVFQIRDPGAYKAMPILHKKLKTYEEKRL